MKLFCLITVILLFVITVPGFSQQFVQKWEFPGELRYVGDIDGDGIGEFAYYDKDSLITTFYDGKDHNVKWTISNRKFEDNMYFDERASAVPKYNKYPLLDYDNDGTMDVFFEDNNKFLIVNPKNNNTIFEFSDSTAVSTDFYVLADIDGNKELDMVLITTFEDGEWNRTYKTYLFSTGITINLENSFKVGSTTTQIRSSVKSDTAFTLEWDFPGKLDYVGDIDNDGIGEFALTDSDQQTITYYDGKNYNAKWNTFGILHEFELFYPDHQHCLLPEYNKFPAYDYNGDGVIDLFFESDTACQIINIVNNSVLFEWDYSYHPILTDSDGDEILELILKTRSRTYVFSTGISTVTQNNNNSFLKNTSSNGRFEKLWEFPEELYFMGDMDGDGIGEFVHRDYDNNITNFYSFQNDNIKWQISDRSFNRSNYYGERMSAMPPFNIFPVFDFTGDNIKEIPHRSNDGKETMLYDVVNDSVVFKLSGQDNADPYLFIISDVNGNGDLELVFRIFYNDSTEATQVYSTGTPVTAVQNTNILHPGEYKLAQNYPNPFNPSTKIEYSISEPSNVSINIFNINGELIKELINEEKNNGNYSATWNGKDNKGNIVASGTYFYQIQVGNFVQAKKMILLK